MDKQQRERGAAAIQVFLHDGEITVLPLDHSRLTHNDGTVEALSQRKAYKGDWTKIWKVLTGEQELNK